MRRLERYASLLWVAAFKIETLQWKKHWCFHNLLNIYRVFQSYIQGTELSAVNFQGLERKTETVLRIIFCWGCSQLQASQRVILLPPRFSETGKRVIFSTKFLNLPFLCNGENLTQSLGQVIHSYGWRPFQHDGGLSDALKGTNTIQEEGKGLYTLVHPPHREDLQIGKCVSWPLVSLTFFWGKGAHSLVIICLTFLYCWHIGSKTSKY